MRSISKTQIALLLLFFIGSVVIIYIGYFLKPFGKQSSPGIDFVETLSGHIVWEAKWSPDGNKIAMITQRRRDQTAPTVINIYDLQRNEVEQVPTSAAELSPYGQWLTFIANTSEGGIVSVAPITGECIFSWLPGLKRADRVDVSPDGKKLLVVSWGDLYIVDTEKAIGPHGLPNQLHCP